jgi:hypothetical protein
MCVKHWLTTKSRRGSGMAFSEVGRILGDGKVLQTGDRACSEVSEEPGFKPRPPQWDIATGKAVRFRSRDFPNHCQFFGK